MGRCIMTLVDDVPMNGINLELWETEQDRIHARSLLNKTNLGSGEALIAFGLTASVPLKQWPLACYCELMSQL